MLVSILTVSLDLTPANLERIFRLILTLSILDIFPAVCKFIYTVIFQSAVWEENDP